MTEKKKINGFTLVMLIVTTSIGAGIFALSSDLAHAAAQGPALIAWLIIGIGVILLAATFNNLLIKCPTLNGIFTYGKKGFGDFAGFISGWGYWMSCWLGNIAISTIFMSTLGYFFPIFSKSNSIYSIIGASICSWLLIFMVSLGIENAAFVDSIITICKLIPIIVFIIASILVFKVNFFSQHFWGNLANSFNFSSTVVQVKNCFMTMMWLFVGIEGATVLAARAKSKKIAGRSTLIGVVALLIIYVLASILPYGYFTRAQLINAPQPPMAYLLEKIVGPWGGLLISVGVLISIIGTWISWTILPSETMCAMAKEKLLPKKLGETNKFGAPIYALITTGVMVQLFLISLLFTNKAYEFAYSLSTASVIITYIIVASYQIKLSSQEKNKRQLFIGIGTLIFETVGILFAGLKYLLVCTIIYIPGLYLYYLAVRKRRKLTTLEKIGMLVIVMIGIAAIWMLLSKKITI
ncbi:basic amino acid/polyamine antiporter [Lactobacillus sp. ESL0680]|uniref:basic amino acid/polyamine antiporter n=1 Tax=Lactobacillus sp. ESL0680 TaxID=2983210 RepID=UPI0023F723B5|nr:basic amino acid/polyamine antiporter [Lactobacillus sp. ESL0680]WEV38581.1 basic amino acid/polyamine antiporter [Lactobacillus sp. ESL0680]